MAVRRRGKLRKAARPQARRGRTRSKSRATSAARRSTTARRASSRPARRTVRSSASRRRAGGTTAAAARVIDMPGPNGRPVPSGIGLTHHHMDYTTHDLDGVRRFYTELLGFTNVITEPSFGYLSILITPCSSLGFMAPTPNLPPESWSPPGEPYLYFFVENVDRVHEDLMAQGVSFDQAPQDMPWGHRMAVCRDPEGRRVCLAQRK